MVVVWLIAGFVAGFVVRAVMARKAQQVALDAMDARACSPPAQQGFATTSGGYWYCWTEWTWHGPVSKCEYRSGGGGGGGNVH